MEMTWLVALNEQVWILCFLARFSMILSGIQLVIWARTDIACLVGVMAFSYGCLVAAIKMSMTPIISTAPSSYGTAVAKNLEKVPVVTVAESRYQRRRGAGAICLQGLPRRTGEQAVPLHLLQLWSYGGSKTTRNPLLLLLDGLLLLRLADRQFCALLFQLPPRITRLEPCACSPNEKTEMVVLMRTVSACLANA